LFHGSSYQPKSDSSIVRAMNLRVPPAVSGSEDPFWRRRWI
jgi:hypothetical protein